MKADDKKIKGLAKLFLLAKNEEEVCGLIFDLFTDPEINKVHERVKIFACLKDGLSQRETKKKANAAIGTITHGSQFLNNSSVVIRRILDTAQKRSWWQGLFWRA